MKSEMMRAAALMAACVSVNSFGHVSVVKFPVIMGNAFLNLKNFNFLDTFNEDFQGGQFPRQVQNEDAIPESGCGSLKKGDLVRAVMTHAINDRRQVTHTGLRYGARGTVKSVDVYTYDRRPLDFDGSGQPIAFMSGRAAKSVTKRGVQVEWEKGSCSPGEDAQIKTINRYGHPDQNNGETYGKCKDFVSELVFTDRRTLVKESEWNKPLVGDYQHGQKIQLSGDRLTPKAPGYVVMQEDADTLLCFAETVMKYAPCFPSSTGRNDLVTYSGDFVVKSAAPSEGYC